MTIETSPSDAELDLPAQYVPGVRGHFVLATGADNDGVEALAVWKLLPDGQAVGAWVMKLDDAAADPDRLAAVLGMVRGRSLVDWSLDRPIAVIDRLCGLLPADLVSDLRAHAVDIPSLLQEIRDCRQAYAEALERYRPTTKSKIVALSWAVDIPDDLEAARRTLTPVPPADVAPVAGQALSVAGAVRRVADLWQDTEQARYRRVYLRSLGEPQALPPRWLAALRAAADSTSPTGQE